MKLRHPRRPWYPMAQSGSSRFGLVKRSKSGFRICPSQTVAAMEMLDSWVRSPGAADQRRCRWPSDPQLDRPKFSDRFCCGQRVSFAIIWPSTSEIVVSKKHTALDRNATLRPGPERRVAQPYRNPRRLDQSVAALRLKRGRCDSYLLQAYEQGISASGSTARHDNGAKPEVRGYRPRTAYSLFNCFTDVLRANADSRASRGISAGTCDLSKL